MRYSLIALAAVAGLASAQSASTTVWVAAPKVTVNPDGAEFIAKLPEQSKNNVRGSVVAKSAPEGKGIKFSVSVSGLPAEGGPFMYHIHEKPVPADGNCTGTGAHLDPYKRGEVPECNPEQKEYCQTGDLSGKWGNFTKDGSAEYTDLYLASSQYDLSYFGNLSVVFHTSNKSRISCANFTIISPGAQLPTEISGYPTPLPTANITIRPTGTGSTGLPGSTTIVPTTVHSANPTQPAPPAEQTTNAAAKMSVAGMGLLAGVLAFAF